MNFKLDENLGCWAAAPLLGYGHDVCTVEAEGLCGRPDHEVLAAASNEGRCLITLDLEFANPLVYPPAGHRGVVVLRVSRRTSKAEVLELLELVVRGLGEPALSTPADGRDHPIDRRVWIVQPGRIRVYQSED
jgi:predicted nuclease of predicted toxin-antitoxin system